MPTWVDDNEDGPSQLDCFYAALETAKAQSGTEPISKDVSALVADAQQIWDWVSGTTPLVANVAVGFGGEGTVHAD